MNSIKINPMTASAMADEALKNVAILSGGELDMNGRTYMELPLGFTSEDLQLYKDSKWIPFVNGEYIPKSADFRYQKMRMLAKGLRLRLRKKEQDWGVLYSEREEFLAIAQLTDTDVVPPMAYDSDVAEYEACITMKRASMQVKVQPVDEKEQRMAVTFTGVEVDSMTDQYDFAFRDESGKACELNSVELRDRLSVALVVKLEEEMRSVRLTERSVFEVFDKFRGLSRVPTLFVNMVNALVAIDRGKEFVIEPGPLLNSREWARFGRPQDVLTFLYGVFTNRRSGMIYRGISRSAHVLSCPQDAAYMVRSEYLREVDKRVVTESLVLRSLVIKTVATIDEVEVLRDKDKECYVVYTERDKEKLVSRKSGVGSVNVRTARTLQGSMYDRVVVVRFDEHDKDYEEVEGVVASATGHLRRCEYVVVGGWSGTDLFVKLARVAISASDGTIRRVNANELARLGRAV